MRCQEEKATAQQGSEEAAGVTCRQSGKGEADTQPWTHTSVGSRGAGGGASAADLVQRLYHSAHQPTPNSPTSGPMSGPYMTLIYRHREMR